MFLAKVLKGFRFPKVFLLKLVKVFEGVIRENIKLFSLNYS